MAKKKTTRKKKVAAKKKLTGKKKVVVKKKAAAPKKASRGGKIVRAKKAAPAKAEVRSAMRSSLGGDYEVERRPARRGLGSNAGGQSGDTQGLNRDERDDSESVEELAEEGQAYEAEAVSGVENALDPDQGEVRTHEVPEDDVPGEYEDKD
jgi:N utilization substance protein A